MHRQWLLSRLQNHIAHDPQERDMQQRLTRFVHEHANCFDRELLVGHITGSAWIVNPERSKVLMIHHRKLNRWLQPGGHSDGDPNTLQVALREAREETGLDSIQPVSEAVFDVDIHTIPARRDEPQHEHFDVRFLLQADDSLPILRTEETNDIAWMTLDEVLQHAQEDSIVRMLNKTRRT
ncbi:MAG: NUDIX hydrolase [Gammaproteobacteria bacterium]|nr:NUDIX hydrolase [Gammaproteobacteria bacterium]